MDRLLDDTHMESKRFRGGTYDDFSIENRDQVYQLFKEVVMKAALQYSISMDRILDGRRDRFSTLARREILSECVTVIGMEHRRVCEWLGITVAGGWYLLNAMNQSGTDGAGLKRD